MLYLRSKQNLTIAYNALYKMPCIIAVPTNELSYGKSIYYGKTEHSKTYVLRRTCHIECATGMADMAIAIPDYKLVWQQYILLIPDF